MTKTELIDEVAERCGLTKKDTGKAIDALFSVMTETLSKGDKIQLVGFGSFEVKERSARMGRNPQTGAAIEIKARKVPVFKPGKALKEAVDR
ncbi:MAG: HU family DNA-binding protein [Firmicutes bacterium]|nr:HU family DNA-binding protein [Bacillota bacterium]